MHVIVYLPFLASAFLALAGPRLGRRMPPKMGTRLLLAAGSTCAVTSLLSLSLLAWTLVHRLPAPLAAALGAWSARRLHHDDAVSPLVAKLAITALAVLACVFAWTAVRRASALHRARRTCRRLGSHAGRLVVHDQDEPEAFAIPAGRKDQGRIVVSTGMLRTLSAAERRVLLAHEAAHLQHRHHRHRALATLVTAVNPLLATIPAAVHQLTERWADEDAATAVEDRQLAAHTLARAALAAHHARRSPAEGAVLCFGRSGVTDRVRALLGDAPPRRPITVALLAAILSTCLLSTWEAGHDTAQMFDRPSDRHHAGPLSITTAAGQEIRHLLTVFGNHIT
jgi:Zn-dependent protease with chaperone function